MSPTHLVRVNKAINAAQVLLGDARSRPQLSKPLERAVCDSVVMQLHLALTLYLREIAENYRLLNPSSIVSVDQLVKRFMAAQKPLAEVEELQRLAGQPNSWLYQLIQSAAEIYNSADPEPIKKAFASSDNSSAPLALISMVEELPKSAAVTITLLEKWAIEFKNLIFRQRETSNEY